MTRTTVVTVSANPGVNGSPPHHQSLERREDGQQHAELPKRLTDHFSRRLAPHNTTQLAIITPSVITLAPLTTHNSTGHAPPSPPGGAPGAFGAIASS